MSKKENSLSDNYIKTIRQFLPINRKTEKDYLTSLQKKVEVFCENATDITNSDIYKEFGNPREAANNYLNSVDIEELMKAINIRKVIHHAFIYIAVVLFIVSFIICFVVSGIKKNQIRDREFSLRAQEYFNELMEEQKS